MSKNGTFLVKYVFCRPILSVRWPILSADNIGQLHQYYRPIYRYRSYTKLNWRRPLNLIYNSKIVSILIPQFATSNITSYFATLYIDIRTNENKHTWSRLNWAKKWNTNRYMWLFTFTILVIFLQASFTTFPSQILAMAFFTMLFETPMIPV